MNARRLADWLPTSEDLLTIAPEKIGLRLLQFFAAIEEQQRRRNVMQTQYIGGPYAVEDYPRQHREAITRTLLEGWQWLQQEGHIIPEGTGSTFRLSRKGETLAGDATNSSLPIASMRS